MSHYGCEVFRRGPTLCPPGQVRPLPVVNYVINRTRGELAVEISKLGTIQRAIERLSTKSRINKKKLSGEALMKAKEKAADKKRRRREKEAQASEVEKKIQGLEGALVTLNAEKKEAMEREQKAKQKRELQKYQAKARAEENDPKHTADTATKQASPPKVRYFLGKAIPVSAKPPTLRRTTITASTTLQKTTKPKAEDELELERSPKRKAEDELELEQSPKRLKPVAETDSPVCTPPEARMERKASPTVAGRGSVPNSRKSSPAENDPLRKTDSKVSKPAHPPQASRRLLTKKVNASAVKKSIVDHTKNHKSEVHSSNNYKVKGNTYAPRSDESSDASATPHHRSSPLSKSNGMKRRASDEREDEHASKKQRVDTPSGPKGLLNRSNACFSNALVQLLAAALENNDLDALLGKLEKAGPFDKVQRRSLAATIQKAAKAGEEGKVSAVAHLRRLLEDMRAPKSSKDSIASPRDFQHVIAYGSAGGDRNRMAMSGETQQDPHEYYEMLFSLLLEDKSIADAAALKAQFVIETATQYTCADCKYESEPMIIMNNHHTVNVPEFDDDGLASTTVKDLLEESKSSEIDADGKCSQCEGRSLRSTTEIKNQPECFVVYLNRTRFGDEASKVNTKVQFDHTLDLEGVKDNNRYTLSAVIMHKGDTPQSGHYTIYRKCDDAWFLINDASTVPKKSSEVEDATRCEGHAAMMLYKRSPIV